jgi:hypothetical protein
MTLPILYPFALNYINLFYNQAKYFFVEIISTFKQSIAKNFDGMTVFVSCKMNLFHNIKNAGTVFIYIWITVGGQASFFRICWNASWACGNFSASEIKMHFLLITVIYNKNGRLFIETIYTHIITRRKQQWKLDFNDSTCTCYYCPFYFCFDGLALTLFVLTPCRCLHFRKYN